MTGRKAVKGTVKKVTTKQQAHPHAQPHSSAKEPADDSDIASNIKKEHPPPPQVVKKIQKAENDEAKTLNTVFKSNPDTQMKEFIKKASTKPPQAVKVPAKLPADSHTPAVAQDLLETDDDVADNLAKLFKTSKSYKNP